MEAPLEKIYLFENPIDNTPDYRWLSKRSCDDDIEYVRLDAFIRKARKYFIKELPNFRSFMESGTTFIKGFESFMKGE